MRGCTSSGSRAGSCGLPVPSRILSPPARPGNCRWARPSATPSDRARAWSEPCGASWYGRSLPEAARACTGSSSSCSCFTWQDWWWSRWRPCTPSIRPCFGEAMEPLLLGIDVGTSAVKAALVDRRGSLHAVGQAEYPLHHIRPAWVEQDPDDWWRGTCQAIREALAKVPHGAERVLGLAVSCQAPALLALDRSGRPLRPAMIWMDRRAEAETLQLAEQMGGDRIYRVTGTRPDALYVAARLLWLRNHEPETLRRTWQFVSASR